MMADGTGLPGFLKHDGAKGSTLKKKMPYNDSASNQNSNDLFEPMKEKNPIFFTKSTDMVLLCQLLRRHVKACTISWYVRKSQQTKPLFFYERKFFPLALGLPSSSPALCRISM